MEALAELEAAPEATTAERLEEGMVDTVEATREAIKVAVAMVVHKVVVVMAKAAKVAS